MLQYEKDNQNAGPGAWGAASMTSCGKDDNNVDETLTLTAGGVSFKMVLVKAGTFSMGANEGDADADGGELGTRLG